MLSDSMPFFSINTRLASLSFFLLGETIITSFFLISVRPETGL